MKKKMPCALMVGMFVTTSMEKEHNNFSNNLRIGIPCHPASPLLLLILKYEKLAPKHIYPCIHYSSGHNN